MSAQIRITSSGSALDTTVTNVPRDGSRPTELEVQAATIWLERNEMNKVDLEMVGPSLDIVAIVGTVTLTCPVCSHSESHECQE
jgi:hypothetical protein